MDFNLGLSILILLSFFLLLLVFTRFFWKPILKNIKDREESIRSDIENAKRLNEDSELLKLRHEKILEDAKKESILIINSAKETAEKNRNIILEEARLESYKIIENSKKTIYDEYEKFKEQIRSEIVSLTISTTEKILGRIIDVNEHKEIIMKSIDNAGKINE